MYSADLVRGERQDHLFPAGFPAADFGIRDSQDVLHYF
jgi:hypothetical protein